MNKSDLSERDICTKFNTSALCRTGWDEMNHKNHVFPNPTFSR